MFTRSKTARVQASIDEVGSPLSKIPSEEDFEFQEELVNQRLAREQLQAEQAVFHEVEMANNAEPSSCKAWRVRDIENELSLTHD
jgi:phage shock protein A